MGGVPKVQWNFMFENSGIFGGFGNEVEKMGPFSESCFTCVFLLGDRSYLHFPSLGHRSKSPDLLSGEIRFDLLL